MKKYFLILVLHANINMLIAQPDRGQSPPTIEQLVKKHHDAIAKAIKISSAQLSKVDEVYKQFFSKIIGAPKGKFAKMEHRPAMLPKEDMDKLVAERNAKFKSFLNEQQFKTVLEVDEKLRPKPPGKEERGGPPPPKQ